MTPPRGSRGHDRNGGPAGGIRRALRAMDPEYERPGYWDRLRTSVMKRASLELARRRRLARVSVAAILSGWSRRLIPVAAAAAVVAAFLIGTEVRQASDASPPLLLEDILANEVGDGAFQAVISGQAPASPVAFMALVEGNVP
ncbi:MAG: hypothetical protein OXQ94_02980 [Gemmatimonadota bacterium]|nr:hypothetical protein [Gemmatimonadota bacterium]MDE2870642.1 hypothetical protein [Gemmatimonadota bacterium]